MENHVMLGHVWRMKKKSPKTARINVRVGPVLHERLTRYGIDEGIGGISDTCRHILAIAMSTVYGKSVGFPIEDLTRNAANVVEVGGASTLGLRVADRDSRYESSLRESSSGSSSDTP